MKTRITYFTFLTGITFLDVNLVFAFKDIIISGLYRDDKTIKIYYFTTIQLSIISH